MTLSDDSRRSEPSFWETVAYLLDVIAPAPSAAVALLKRQARERRAQQNSGPRSPS